MIVAVTGGSGCGKSVVCRAGADLGYKVIHADETGHTVILKGKPAYNEILSFFGESVLRPDGEIDRKKLGGIVFADPAKLKKLNEITHGRITEEIEKHLEGNVIIDGAVLHQTSIIDKCGYVITVSCPEEKRIENMRGRDNITLQGAKDRISSQLSDGQYRKLADAVIINDGTKEQLYEKAKTVLAEVMD